MAVVLPAPSGPLGVNIHSMELTDHSRPNPWAAQPAHRSIMVSIFTPTGSRTDCTNSTIPYMPAAVADFYDQTYSQYGIPNDTFASISLPNCDMPTNRIPKYPILLFSPGLGNSRLTYSALASEISSFGLTVITIDHPYDAAIVAFPSGTTITAANISTEAQIIFALDVRTADVAFLTASLPHLLPSPHGPVMIAGHSLGGATAAEAMLTVPQLTAGANLDGSFWGAATKPSSTWTAPFLLFGQDKKITSDKTWSSIWPRLHGARAYVELHGSLDGTYTDLAYLVQFLGLRKDLPEAVSKLLGSIDGVEAFKAITEVLVAWFKGIAAGNGATGVRGVRGVAKWDANLSCVRC